MKRLFLLITILSLSVSAFAQFPLGADRAKIKAYFAENVPYASVQEFKADNGNLAMCFTKAQVIGDYTFYFDNNGLCSFYLVTYDRKEVKDVVDRFDNKFCKMFNHEWLSEEGSFAVTLVPSKMGENFFTVIYKPSSPVAAPTRTINNTLASN